MSKHQQLAASLTVERAEIDDSPAKGKALWSNQGASDALSFALHAIEVSTDLAAALGSESDSYRAEAEQSTGKDAHRAMAASHMLDAIASRL